MLGERAYVPDASPSAHLTADELLHVRIPDKHVELIRGVVVVREPTGLRHGRVTMELARHLADHVEARALGRVYAAETGFKLAADPDTVRAPDLAFISHERLLDPEPAGYRALAPDLVVEVLWLGDQSNFYSESVPWIGS